MPKRRANGEGNIRKRKDGRWEGRYTVGHNPETGKAIIKNVLGKTQAEVVQKLKDLKSARDDGIDLDAAKMTVAQWLDIWMQEYRSGIKASTKATYAQDIRLHIIPDIGDIKLSRLTAVHVQKMYNQAMKRGLSPKSIKNTHGILHKALEQAVKLGYIDRNVCDSCELPAIRKKEIYVVDPAVKPGSWRDNEFPGATPEIQYHAAHPY